MLTLQMRQLLLHLEKPRHLAPPVKKSYFGVYCFKYSRVVGNKISMSQLLTSNISTQMLIYKIISKVDI